MSCVYYNFKKESGLVCFVVVFESQKRLCQVQVNEQRPREVAKLAGRQEEDGSPCLSSPLHSPLTE